MFSASLELVLTVAYREAVSRRHAYLTLEHLLYALAHDPEGERILVACGADLARLRRDLDKYLDESIEHVRRGHEREPEQTAAFRRVLQTAVLHVQSAQRQEVQAGDICAAILQQPDTEAARLLAGHGITRLDILEYISHGITKTPIAELPHGAGDSPTAGTGDEGPAASGDPLAAYCLNLTDRAREGLLDPLIGRTDELQRTIEVLCRRRKNNPVFVGDLPSTVGARAVTGGTMDLATLMKPILTSGDLRVIGSTTFEEFKHLEKDRALARRLQKIAIDEPSVEQTVRILAGLRSRYEEHHGVTYTDVALEAAAKLAARHLRDSRLPDSAIDLIDEAGSVTRLSPKAPEDADAGVVDAADIERVVARMARIPARQASSSDRDRLRTLEESLERVVFGQHEAVHLVAQAIKRSRAGLGQPDRPVGCFLFTGPTGVGKTELSKQLALQLGNEFLRFDMSEYMEKHAVARLIGAPPGYVGFEQGGQLVDAVRMHPYSVVLLDEFEKAHQDIYNILLQVMDHATLTDNTGRKADFRNVVLILTSNAGSRELSEKTIGFADGMAGDDRDEAVRRVSAGKSKAALERAFSPEFRNRLDAIVTFRALTPSVMETIVEKFVLQLEGQLAERHVAITLTPEARAWLAVKGYDPVYGARPLGRVIQREVRDPLTD